VPFNQLSGILTVQPVVLTETPDYRAIYEILIIALLASLAGNWIVKSPALDDLSAPKLITATAGYAA
jgi:hypothetical protein